VIGTIAGDIIGADALQRIEDLRGRLPDGRLPSPETEEQRLLVLFWNVEE